jgi:hypothetical protein
MVVGGNEHGEQSYRFYDPRGLLFDRQDNIYVVDSWNDRIKKFEIDFN